MKVITMLFATGLAACGSVITNGSGSGSDNGSGSGSDNGSGSDTVAHPPGQLYGTVRDERGDTIDFTTGEPVHTHAGAMIDLSDECPVVYRYAYLLDQQNPLFGRQITPNPLAWNISPDLTSVDASATTYRVRAEDGRVLLDWTTTAPDPQGSYTIELHRNGDHPIAALGTETGKLHLDVRFRDTMGTETVDSACWEHHPLAAPLETTPIGQADLFQMSLGGSAPISKLMNPISATYGLGYGVDVASHQIIQQTAEPVTFALTVPQPTGAVSETYVDAYLASDTTATQLACDDAFSGACARTVPGQQTFSTSGDLTSQWLARVVDDTTGTVICHTDDSAVTASIGVASCTLPPRVQGSAPHSYRVVLSVGAVSVLELPELAIQPYAELAVGAIHFTGDKQDNYATACGHVYVKSIPGSDPIIMCTLTTYYARAYALDAAHIDFDPITIGIATAPGVGLAMDAIASTAAPAASWDAGSGGF